MRAKVPVPKIPATRSTGCQTPGAPAATGAARFQAPAVGEPNLGENEINLGMQQGINFFPNCDFAPNIMPSARSELGVHVPQATKEKIMQGQYVDLACLLQNANQNELPTSRLSVDSFGQLTLAPPVTRKIVSVEDWSDAFLVYASIYLGAHPDKTQSVLK